ncbi:MAG: ThuA domain-containing protein [Chryseolinea sp.]
MKQHSRMVSHIKGLLSHHSYTKFVSMCIPMLLLFGDVNAQHATTRGKIKVFVIAAKDQSHSAMVDQASVMFKKIGDDNSYQIDFSKDTALLTTANLAKYDVIIQLHVSPLSLARKHQFAIQQFISKGKGWIGIHAAGVRAEQADLEAQDHWKWYSQLLGGARYTPLPPVREGLVTIEARTHPVTKNLSASFALTDEWYSFDKQLGSDAIILATADVDKKGKQPVIWINPHFDRALYIALGHDASSCTNASYHTLLKDAISWAAIHEGVEVHKMEEFTKSSGSILVNQVGYNANLPKAAVFKTKVKLNGDITFSIVDALSFEPAYSGKIKTSEQVLDWNDAWYSQIDFSQFKKPGFYKIKAEIDHQTYESFNFEIGDHLLAETLIPAIANFFVGQKANSKEELSGDEHVRLFGSDKTVDLRGGWADASGDVSKYFSHLAYTNFMSPQQIPLADWSMIQSVESIPSVLRGSVVEDSLRLEAFYGADYIMKSLSTEGYFYMTLFSYFKKDPSERRVVGLLADSKTTSEYQAGYREGGGMGVACLARISTWKQKSKYSQAQYLKAAERAFEHLQKNSIKYIDDHKENIIDDYTALMGSTELWIATKNFSYRREARLRAKKLADRISTEGFFWSNDEKTRPFWHASDAGLPVISLIRYLQVETDAPMREKALETIKKFIDYQLRVSKETVNPFRYPRQTFKVNGEIKNGFFIPHENESGWWWQGEDARIGSLASVLLRGGRLVYPENNALGVRSDIGEVACNLVGWVLGCNPYQVCMMYGYGQINVPYMAAMYGHGSGIGGISNGITGANGKPDGSGIDFKYEDNGNEWRWSEQWIPHSAWFLQAITAIESK